MFDWGAALSLARGEPCPQCVHRTSEGGRCERWKECIGDAPEPPKETGSVQG